MTALECLEGTTPPSCPPNHGARRQRRHRRRQCGVYRQRELKAPTAALTVTLTVADDASSDFLASSDEGEKTVTIASGQTSATLTVPTQE